MHRFILRASILAALAVVGIFTVSFLVNALDVMHGASKIDPMAFVRFKSTPIRDLGYTGAALIASIGVLLVCLRYALRVAPD